MKKFADISLAVEEIIIEEQSLVRISVTAVNLKDWCLCLQLLYDNLIEAFTFRCANSPTTMQVRRNVENCQSITDNANGLGLALSVRDIDYVRHFFLRYYRDGVAEVDHIDIETEEGGYITFTVDEALPPVSEEEAKRRLGM